MFDNDPQTPSITDPTIPAADAIMQSLDTVGGHTKFFRKAVQTYIENKDMLEKISQYKDLQDQLTGAATRTSQTGDLANDAVASGAQQIQMQELLGSLGQGISK